MPRDRSLVGAGEAQRAEAEAVGGGGGGGHTPEWECCWLLGLAEGGGQGLLLLHGRQTPHWHGGGEERGAGGGAEGELARLPGLLRSVRSPRA